MHTSVLMWPESGNSTISDLARGEEERLRNRFDRLMARNSGTGFKERELTRLPQPTVSTNVAFVLENKIELTMRSVQRLFPLTNLSESPDPAINVDTLFRTLAEATSRSTIPASILVFRRSNLHTSIMITRPVKRGPC